MSEYIEKTINEIRDVQEKINEEASKENDKTPKNGEESTPKPEDVSPGLGAVLFNQISETSIKILQTPAVEEGIIKIATNMNMDEESVTSLINIIAISMTNASLQAILFYDDLLKNELTKQMDNVSYHINLGKADIEGIKAAVQVHQKQIGSINNTLKINDIKKENNK